MSDQSKLNALLAERELCRSRLAALNTEITRLNEIVTAPIKLEKERVRAELRKEVDERVALRKQWSSDRKIKAVELKDSGKTYKEVAAALGVSVGVAISIVRQGRTHINWLNREPYLYSNSASALR